MPKTMTHVETATIDGVAHKRVAEVTAVGATEVHPTVAAAPAGSLTTRTDNNTGTVTMSSGHGVTTGKAFAFWSGGSRYGMDATVTGDSIVLDGGSGDNLPAANTAIRVTNGESVEFVIDGDYPLTGLVLSISGEVDVDGYVQIFDDEGTPAVIETYQLARNEATIWNGVGTNPFAGEITTTALFAHGHSAARVMNLIALLGTDS
ncbi:MAG: hypothetical protein KF873_02010 [Gemmataceae bacterium]|nr:hypothetical protein [Gemmataceae bacterium]